MSRLVDQGGGGLQPPSLLKKRAAYLEFESAAAAHPNRTYYLPAASTAATIARCTRELATARVEATEYRELRRERATARFRAGDLDGSLADYSAALTNFEEHRDPADASALRYLRGEVLAKMNGREHEAIADFTACLALQPKHAQAYYMRASCYNRVGEFTKAIDDYNLALELDKPGGGEKRPGGGVDKRPSVTLGADAYAAERERELRGRLEASVSEMEAKSLRMVAERARHPELRSAPPTAARRGAEEAAAAHARGVALRRNRDFAGAVGAYDECLDIDPTHFRALFDRAFAYDALGELRSAIADYTRAIALEPEHALARYNRGIAQERLGLAREAIADFSFAIDCAEALQQQQQQQQGNTTTRNSSSEGELPVADFHHNRAFCKRKLQDFAGAVADYTAALRRDPAHFKALYNRAFCLDALGDREGALADYEAAVDLRATHASAHHNRGVVLEKVGRLEEALLAFDTAIRLAGSSHASPEKKSPPPSSKRNNNGKAARRDDAQQHLDGGGGEQCLGAALYARALVLERLRKLDAAGASFERATRVRPRDAEYRHAHGANLRHRGLHDEAVTAFTEALRLEPRHRAALSNRAYSLRKLARFPEAIADYTEAIDLATATAAAAVDVGPQIHRPQSSDDNDDDDDDDDVCRGKPGSFPAASPSGSSSSLALAKLRNARAYCHARRDDFAAALADYSAAIALDPNNPHAYHNRAISHDRLGNFEASMADFAKVLDLEAHRTAAANNDADLAGAASGDAAGGNDDDQRPTSIRHKPRAVYDK